MVLHESLHQFVLGWNRACVIDGEESFCHKRFASIQQESANWKSVAIENYLVPIDRHLGRRNSKHGDLRAMTHVGERFPGKPMVLPTSPGPHRSLPAYRRS